MRKIYPAIFSLCLMASPLIAQQAPAPTPASAPTPAVRHRVAVLDFGYATVMTESQAVFGTNVDIGKGISDMLIDKMLNDGTYRIIERNAFDKILNEQNFSNSNRADPATAAKIGHILGVDAVITGDITQFGRDDQNKNYGGAAVGAWTHGAFGGVGKHESKAVVGITVRMVDASTGEILASVSGKGESSRSGTSLLGGGYGGGSGAAAGYDMTSSNFAQTIIGEATTAAVDQVAQGLDAKSASLPTAPPPPAVVVNGLIADASTSDIIINVGSQAGVKVGDKLAVTRVVRVVKDPTTGKPLRSIENQIGQLTITSVDATSAVGSFNGTGLPKIGDTVKTP
jgi:curli biogenesis system outer membrane secretion channel CsgG